MAYQTMSGYDGSLLGNQKYNGIEYDYEVDDGNVIGSPGGVSSIHHHPTHGFNGEGNTSSDIYAGQGERYISGEYGNLYQTGHSAVQQSGYYPAAPDPQYWQNQQPQQDSSMDTGVLYNGGIGPGQHDGPEQAPNPPGGAAIERFTNMGSQDFDLIESDVNSGLSQGDTSPKTVPAWLVLVILFLVFLTFTYWASAAQLFVQQKYQKSSRTLTWQNALIFAVVVSVILGVIVWASGISLPDIEY